MLYYCAYMDYEYLFLKLLFYLSIFKIYKRKFVILAAKTLLLLFFFFFSFGFPLCILTNKTFFSLCGCTQNNFRFFDPHVFFRSVSLVSSRNKKKVTSNHRFLNCESFFFPFYLFCSKFSFFDLRFLKDCQGKRKIFERSYKRSYGVNNSYFHYNSPLSQMNMMSEKKNQTLKLRNAYDNFDIYKNFKSKIKENDNTVESLLLSHILLETKEMAYSLVDVMKKSVITFSEYAASISRCTYTRNNGGKIGWIYKQDTKTYQHIIPPELFSDLFAIKPGDYKILETSRGFHIFKVDNAFVDIKPNTFLKSAKNETKDKDSKNLFRSDKNSEGFLKKYYFSSKRKFYIDTMGCQMNKADSERMLGQMISLGFELTEDSLDANVIIINTCSIRYAAQHKLYSHIGPHASRKRRGEDVTIVVAGCVAQQEGQKMLREVPEVDIVIGPQFANSLALILQSYFLNEGSMQMEATSTIPIIVEDSSRQVRESLISGWVNVIYGCNQKCSYCVVPNTRGVEQSRPKEMIRKEIEELVDLGYKEVTLLGQNIDSWGGDFSPKQTFSDLLNYLAETTNIARIRFITSHPRYMSRKVVEAVATHKNICEYFHVPFQSGDDLILRRMRRGYTHGQYLRIMENIRNIIPDASLSADVIVGFPGETEEQFEKSLEIMKAVEFDNVYTFAYSRRPNTVAAEFEDQVSEDVKDSRLKRIIDLNIKHAQKRSSRYLNRIEEVLVESINPKLSNEVQGRTRGNKLVFFKGDIEKLKGKLVSVKITETRAFSLSGIPVDSHI